MKYITLICNAGLSTNLLVNKMRKIAAEQNLDVTITAMAHFAFEQHKLPTDILLLGPQIGYQYESFRETMEPKGIPVVVIDSLLYGAMDAQAVLQLAMDQLT